MLLKIDSNLVYCLIPPIILVICVLHKLLRPVLLLIIVSLLVKKKLFQYLNVQENMHFHLIFSNVRQFLSHQSNLYCEKVYNFKYIKL